jgi:hypothetical protein
MKLVRSFSIFFIVLYCFTFVPAALSDNSDTTGTSSSSSNDFLKGLMGILQENIDDFIGNYKGRLGDVKLIERVGNKIVLEVTYDNVKRSDNVFVQGEVLDFGTPLENFSNSLNAVSGRRGKVKLAIKWSQKEDAAWGTANSEVQSDQIRLFLVRKSNLDKPFGEIIYDISKTWTNSDAPDEESTDEESVVAENDAIELEDNQTTEETQNTGSDQNPPNTVFVKPGTVLKPLSPRSPALTQPATATTTTAKAEVKPAPKTIAPIKTVQTPQKPYVVNSYDFYQNAKSAMWRSGAGKLLFPGSGNDQKGFVRQITKGKLNSGNSAVNMLETHPQWKSGGWIEGRFPLMILGSKLHFKSIAGFLQGANQTDGATFRLYVLYNSKAYRVVNAKVSSKKYVTINADLSRWSGKKVQIVFHVRAGNNSAQDWCVWVKPRLSK